MLRTPVFPIDIDGSDGDGDGDSDGDSDGNLPAVVVAVVWHTALVVAREARHALALLWWGFYTTFFARPLTALYLRGPRALGMWQSMPVSDICAAKTGIAAAHWDLHREVCLERIGADVDALAVTLWLVAALFLGWKIFDLVWHLCVVRPLRRIFVRRRHRHRQKDACK